MPSVTANVTANVTDFRKVDFIVFMHSELAGSRGLCDFEDDFEFYRHPKRKTRDADDRPNGSFLNTEDISEQVRGCVCDPGLIEEVSGGRYEYSEADDASHTIECAKMLFGRCERV